nr:MAG TPA: Rep protein [Cressdnaviricota sp.]
MPGYNGTENLPKEWVEFRISQMEKCPNTGAIHEQGYLCLTSKKTIGQLKEFMPTAHFDLRVGSHSQAKHYCTKPHEGCECVHCISHPKEFTLSNPTEYGDDSNISDNKGERTDWKKIVTLAKEDKIDEIIEEFPSQFLRCHRGVEKIQVTKFWSSF